MQEDGDLEALQILEPARSLLDDFDPGVVSLTGNIGNAREIDHHCADAVSAFEPPT